MIRRLVRSAAFKRIFQRPANTILMFFICVIAVGTILLILPVSTSSGKSCGFLTALFTSTSAACVTGLTVVNTETYWSLFGQIAIIIICQIGGLGYMSTISFFYLASDRRIGLRQRMVLVESLNLSEFEGVVALVKYVLKGTVTFEAIGALILACCFAPEFGLLGGLWRGVFMAISSFCNAGFTVVYTESFFSGTMAFGGNPIILITMLALVILGSIGFYVWGDVYKKRSFKKLRLHSKLAIATTAILIITGTVAYMALETGEGGSLSSLSEGRKLVASIFQSVSDRTLGIHATNALQKTDQTNFITGVLMFIGGSSGSTAGGLKTVTIAILILSIISTLRGRPELIIFGRKIANVQIIQACTLVFVGCAIILTGAFVVSLLNDVDFGRSLAETTAAYSTSGLSTGLTQAAGQPTTIIYIVLMFMGKIGVLSASVSFMMRNGRQIDYTYPTERVIVG